MTAFREELYIWNRLSTVELAMIVVAAGTQGVPMGMSRRRERLWDAIFMVRVQRTRERQIAREINLTGQMAKGKDVSQTQDAGRHAQGATPAMVHAGSSKKIRRQTEKVAA